MNQRESCVDELELQIKIAKNLMENRIMFVAMPVINGEELSELLDEQAGRLNILRWDKEKKMKLTTKNTGEVINIDPCCINDVANGDIRGGSILTVSDNIVIHVNEDPLLIAEMLNNTGEPLY